jgi:hypothetical protein
VVRSHPAPQVEAAPHAQAPTMKILAAIALALTLISVSPDTSHAQDNLDFTLINDTGRVITSLRFKAHGSLYWGNDVLFDGVLLPGQIVPIVFYYAASCSSDIQLGYLDGSTQEYRDGQNLCRTTAIRFRPRRMSWTNGGSL